MCDPTPQGSNESRVRVVRLAAQKERPRWFPRRANALTTVHARKAGGMKTVQSRELLMAVANDATTIPRDFKHVRRMRAVLTAELQR